MPSSKAKTSNDRGAVSKVYANKAHLPVSGTIKGRRPSNEPHLRSSDVPGNDDEAKAATSGMCIDVPSLTMDGTSDCVGETELSRTLMQERDEILCRIRIDACRLNDIEEKLLLLLRREPSSSGLGERSGTIQARCSNDFDSSTSRRQILSDLLQPRPRHSMQQAVWDSASMDQSTHDTLSLERERGLTTDVSLNGRELTPIRHPPTLVFNPAWPFSTPIPVREEVEVSRQCNPALDVYVMTTRSGKRMVATALRDTGCEATAITEDLVKDPDAYAVECQSGDVLLTINKERITPSKRCRLYVGLPGQDSLLEIDVYVVKTTHKKNVGPKLFLSAGVVICTNLIPALSMHERQLLMPGVQ